MHALWFIVFAWLFLGGTTMPAKRASRKVKSLPRQHFEYLDEWFLYGANWWVSTA